MENITDNTNENEVLEQQETEVTTQEGFKLGLFIKIAVGVIFTYALIMYAWDNFLHAWWTFQAPSWLKTGFTWFLWLDVSYVIYKQVKKL